MNISKIKSGVSKYQEIMHRYWQVNVTKDFFFQKKFNGFYRVRRNKEWRNFYYRILENLKINNLKFREILNKLYQETGNIEASYASKLNATRNPEYPIIDKWILGNFGLMLPRTYEKHRLEKIISLYDMLIQRYDELMLSSDGEEYINKFDQICPNVQISRIKKIDFIIWQDRD